MDGWTGTIIINILLSFVYVIFAGILTNVKPSLRHMFFGIFVVSFIRVIGLFFAQTVPIMKILSTLIVTYFSIKIAFKRNVMLAFSDTIIIGITYGGCLIIAGFLEYVFFGVKNWSVNHSIFATRESNILAIMVTSLLLLFCGIIFLYKKYILTNFKRKLFSKSLFVIIGAYGITFLNFSLEYQYDGGNIMKINLSVLMMIVGLYVGTNYAISNYTLYKEMEQNKTAAQQVEAMKQVMEELRTFKHNYLNILYGFGTKIEEFEELKEYYNETVETSSRINNDNIFAIDKIKICPLRNLFIKHIKKSNEIGIKFILCVESDFSKLPIKNNDICQVIGMFLDNSREAAECTDLKEIKVDILNGDEFLEIYIYNTFVEKDDLQIQREKEEGRGMGLIYCNKILNKYKNIIHNQYIESYYFVQQLVMEK